MKLTQISINKQFSASVSHQQDMLCVSVCTYFVMLFGAWHTQYTEKNAIFQKPLHYQHKNLWSGKSVENLIKLYVIFLPFLRPPYTCSL